MAFLQFDSTGIETTESFEPLPAGWYTVEISNSELKPTKNGAGEYLQLELTVLDGAQAGRKVWDRLNIHNPNQQAVEISRKTLATICRSVRRESIQDSSELHNKPLQAKVVVRPASGGYDAGNDIKGYRAITGKELSVPQVPQAPEAPPPGDMPAWA